MDRATSGFGRKPMLPTGTGYYRGEADPSRAAPAPMAPPLAPQASFQPAPMPIHAPIADHDIDYRIVGHELQFLEITLDPGESVVAEPGAMVWKDFHIDISTTLGDGSAEDEAIITKLLGAGKRALMGEGLFTVTFTNQGVGLTKPASIAFAASVPGNIIPLRLADYGGKIICQKQSFIAAARGVKVGLKLIPGLTRSNGASRARAVMTGMFGGEGFLMQVIEGTGWAFVHMGGTVIERELAAGDRMHVDPGCVAAYTETVDYSIVSAGPGIRNKMFGGEGMILAALTGPGRVWIQSMPIARLAAQMALANDSGGGGGLMREMGEEAATGVGKAAAMGAAGLAGAAILNSDGDGLLGQFGKLFGE